LVCGIFVSCRRQIVPHSPDPASGGIGLTPGRTRFALEASQRVGIRCDGLGEDLDRDVPVHAERREDLARADARAGVASFTNARGRDPLLLKKARMVFR
jgi:hypothetical protein